MNSENPIETRSAGFPVDHNKPFKFQGFHFKRRNLKVFFYLTTKKVKKNVTSSKPVFPLPLTAEQSKIVENWEEDDFLCRNYILNFLADELYDYYSILKTTKEVWDALKKKYDTEEAGTKKYAVSRYLRFQMVDDKSVVSQSHELQKIAHEVLVEGMTICEQFQVSTIIDELPPAWREFKNTLLHKTEEFSMESLITSLRIEEEHRKLDKKDEILAVSYNRNKPNASLKPTRKPMKPTPNRKNNIQNQNRNQNPNRNQNQNENQTQAPTRSHQQSV